MTMDSCSTEIVSLIVEHACSDNAGNTARRLGLVSKYFRAIAEPIELRTIEVAGLKQLREAIARLERVAQSPAEAHETSGKEIDVRHLFISEVTKKHALAADTKFDNGSYGERSSFWRTEEGEVEEAFYLEHSDEFWTLATELVRRTSSTMRTLFLLASNNWFTWRGTYNSQPARPKVIGALFGVTFPRLVSLTVDHDATSEVKSIGYKGGQFESPQIPSLRRLHIISWVFTDRFRRSPGLPENLHPLLACSYPKCNELEQLIVRTDPMSSVEDVMKAVFREEWPNLLRTRTLPGKLRSVIIKQGIVPYFGCGTGYMNYRQKTQTFVDNVMDLNIDGLEARPPIPMFPKAGQKGYELFLADWSEQCSA